MTIEVHVDGSYTVAIYTADVGFDPELRGKE